MFHIYMKQYKTNVTETTASTLEKSIIGEIQENNQSSQKQLSYTKLKEKKLQVEERRMGATTEV